MVKSSVITHLNTFKKTYFSQNGEEGILLEIFKRLNIKKGFFCEFGAWDGQHLSNTYYFYKNLKWDGLYIEADAEKIKDLYTNIPDTNILKECCFVEIEGENSLDNIFKRNAIKAEIDLLSIDIDSDDYAVWKNFTNHSAKVVIIEINQTIPTHIEYIQPPKAYHGNSARAVYNLGIAKGYALVASTDHNLIFVKKELCKTLKIQDDLRLEDVFTPKNCLFMTYDGKVHQHQKPTPKHVWTTERIIVIPSFKTILKALGLFNMVKFIYRKIFK